MFKRKLQTSLIVLMSIFISAVSMEAQAWSYGVSWYSDIDFTLSTKGNKLKLANGNFVVSEIYAFSYVSICVATNSGKLTIHSGLGNNGGSVVIANLDEGNSDDSKKTRGLFTAEGTISLVNMYKHYLDFSPSTGKACYDLDETFTNSDGDIETRPGLPTGDCTELDRDPNHTSHFCHATADQKVEHKDDVYMPQIAIYVRIVKGDGGEFPVGCDPLGENCEYTVIAHGIAECTYTGNVTVGEDGGFDTTKKPAECDVTEYKLSDDLPSDHILSF